MSKYYEEKLPEGYGEALTVDAGDVERSKAIRTAAVITAAVLFNLWFFLYALPRIKEIAGGFSVIKCLLALLAYPLYVVLHELTHGAVYKLLTGRKLTFGFKPPAAYCGVPDIYVYRLTSLISLLAPFTVFGIVFIVSFLAIHEPFSRALIAVLFLLHLTGCSGDLYGAGLLFFRFRDPATLRRDTGPVQTYYTRD